VTGATVLKETISDMEAISIMEKANEGIPDEQLRLAMMYEKGIFVPMDREASDFWLNKAADNGNKTAQLIFCNRYDGLLD